MSKPERFFLYKVTRTEETEDRQDEPIMLGLLDLDVTRYPRLRALHPFFETEPWFTVGQTMIVPLSSTHAQALEQRKWKVKLRGHGRPLTDSERDLMAICEERSRTLEAGRNEILSFINPYGDYVRAGVVAQYPRTAQMGEELKELRAAGILPDDVADTMAAVAARFVELRSDLESKGWTFRRDGAPCPPSSGGRPAKFPRDAIRSYYRQLANLHLGSGTPQDVVEHVQNALRPYFGDLTADEVREAVKYELKRQA